MALIDLSKYDNRISNNVGTANVSDNGEAAAYNEMAKFGGNLANIATNLLAKKIDIETSLDANQAEQNMQKEIAQTKVEAEAMDPGMTGILPNGMRYSEYIATKTDEIHSKYKDSLDRDFAKRKFEFQTADSVKQEKVNAVFTEATKINERIDFTFKQTATKLANEISLNNIGNIVSGINKATDSTKNIMDSAAKVNYSLKDKLTFQQANLFFQQGAHATVINASKDPSAVVDFFEMTGWAARFQTSEGIDKKRLGQYVIDNKENLTFFKDMDNDAINKNIEDIVDDYIVVKGGSSMSAKDVVKSSGLMNAQYFDSILSKVEPKELNGFIDDFLKIRMDMGTGKVATLGEAMKVAESFKETSSQNPNTRATLTNELFQKTQGLTPSQANDVFNKASENFETQNVAMDLGLNGDRALLSTVARIKAMSKELSDQYASVNPEYAEYMKQVYPHIQQGTEERNVRKLQATYTGEVNNDPIKYLVKYSPGAQNTATKLTKALASGSPTAFALAADMEKRSLALNKTRPSLEGSADPKNFYKSLDLSSIKNTLDNARSKGEEFYGRALNNIVKGVPESHRVYLIKALTTEDQADALIAASLMGKESSAQEVGNFASSSIKAKNFDQNLTKAVGGGGDALAKVTGIASEVTSSVFGTKGSIGGEAASSYRKALNTTMLTMAKAYKNDYPNASDDELKRHLNEAVKQKFFFTETKAGSVILPSNQTYWANKEAFNLGLLKTQRQQVYEIKAGNIKFDLDRMPRIKKYLQDTNVNLNDNAAVGKAILAQPNVEIKLFNEDMDLSGKKENVQSYIMQNGIAYPMYTISRTGKKSVLKANSSVVFGNANTSTTGETASNQFSDRWNQ